MRDRAAKQLKTVWHARWLFLLLTAWAVVLVWFTLDKAFWGRFGVSGYSFTVFCGSVAALSGAVLGITAAAIALVSHFSLSVLPNSRDVMTREGRLLKDWLNCDRINYEDFPTDLSEQLRYLVQISSEASSGPVEEGDSGRWGKTTLAVISSLSEYISRQQNVCKERADPVGLPEESSVSESKKCGPGQVSRRPTEQSLQALANLWAHVAAIVSALHRLETALLSQSLVDILVRNSYFAGFTLFLSLICLLWGGIQSAGVDLLSDNRRLYWAIWLAGALSSTLLSTLQAVSLYSRILTLERRGIVSIL